MAMPLGLRSNSASAQTTVCSLGIGKADFTLAALASVNGSGDSWNEPSSSCAREPSIALRASCTLGAYSAFDRSACRNRHPRCPLGNLGRRLAGSLSGPLNLLQRVEAFVEYAHGRFFLVGEQTVRIALFLMRTSVYSALYAFGSAARPGAGNSSKIDKHWAVQGGAPTIASISTRCSRARASGGQLTASKTLGFLPYRHRCRCGKTGAELWNSPTLGSYCKP